MKMWRSRVKRHWEKLWNILVTLIWLLTHFSPSYEITTIIIIVLILSTVFVLCRNIEWLEKDVEMFDE